MAFDDNQKNKNDNEHKNTRDNRSQREERHERDERDERETRQRRSDLRTITPTTADGSRASIYVKEGKKILEASNNKTSGLLAPSHELARKLSDEFGFTVLYTRADNDLMYHLTIFENNNTPVLREELKNTRRRSDEKIYEYSTTADCVTKEIIDSIAEWLQDEVEFSGSMYFTGVTVIPASVTFDENNTQTLVNTILYDAQDSNVLVSGEDTPWNSDQLDKKSRVRVKMNFVPDDEKKDIIGLPVRSDFQLNVVEHQKERRGNMLTRTGSNKHIVNVDGYIACRYIGQDKSRDGRYEFESFVPEVIATANVPSSNSFTGANYHRSVLGVACLPALKDGDAWRKGFESNIHGADSRISGLAYAMLWDDGQLPNDIDDIDDDAKTRESFLNKIFHKEERGSNVPVEYALIIKEGAYGYATNKLWLDVASGDRVALDKLVKVIDELTHGVSLDYMTLDRAEDVIAGQVRLPMGYVITEHGHRDAEVIDLLYVVNRLKNNEPDKLEDFLECIQIADRKFDHDEAMTKLLAVYDYVTDGKFVHTGFQTKLYFNPKFLEDLADSIKHKDADLDIEIDSNIELTDRALRRGHGLRQSAGMSRSTLGRSRERHGRYDRNAGSTRYR